MNVTIDRFAESARTSADASLPLREPCGDEPADEKTLLGIRQARDRALGKNRDLIDQLSGAEDKIAELTYERDDLTMARDLAAVKAAHFEKESGELRSRIALLNEQLTTAEQSYHVARMELEEDLLQLAKERDEAVELAHANAFELEQLRAVVAAIRGAADAPAVETHDGEVIPFSLPAPQEYPFSFKSSREPEAPGEAEAFPLRLHRDEDEPA
jgi:chromosome segregation ATPase